MTYGSLFSGVGGFDLGLDRAGYECRWQCEIDPFCRQILRKHWPGVTQYGDITKLTGDELEPVDLLCGGFPCQDLSYAGKQAGIEAARSGLWFEYARLIGELRPRYVLIENVPGLLVHDGMRRVVGELARLGYVGIWRCFRASEFGASHLRKRVLLVAYRSIDGCELHTQNGTEGISRYRQSEPSRTGVAYRDGAGREARDELRIAGEPAYRESGDRRVALAHANEGSQFRQSAVHGGSHASGYDADGRHTAVADAAGQRPALAHEQLRRRWAEDADRSGRVGEYVEDTGCGSGQRREQPRYAGRGQRKGTDRSSESAGGTLADGWLGAFAPGPSDPRWPEILRARPDLAPALANAVIKRNGGRDAGHCDLRRNGTEGKIRQSSGAGSAGDAGHGTAPSESPFRGVADGLSSGIHGDPMKDRTKRLSRLGNSVVPQIAEYIGRKLLEFDA